MKVKSTNIKRLLQLYKEISLLGNIGALLGWDMEVNLPPKGVNGRAEQSAYITKLVTEKWNDPEFRGLIEDTNDKGLTLEEKAILRNLRQGAKFYYKVPKKIIIEITEVSSKAFMAWHKAKEENKYKEFLPYLKKIIKLNQLVAEHIGYKDNPYDALLDLFEQDLTTKKVDAVFRVLQPALVELVRKIKKSVSFKMPDTINPDLEYPVDDQEQLTLFVLRRMGYDFEGGRQDKSSHPFTIGMGPGDVRITNRYKTNNFVESLMVAMHEGGHALYDQGVREDYEHTPLDGGVSLGIHESQSRFWENQIGRSKAFAEFITPAIQAFYPKQLGKVSAEDLFRKFNKVQPGFIRVEADEVTYNLHIALRFELEEKLMNDKVKAEDLPEIWRDKMKKYLGIVPETDREGVLQDVHWSHGSLGYFPTYTLGNLYAAQITATMQNDLKLNEVTKRGELGPILSWLRTNIHQYGSLYLPDELIMKVSGEKLNPKYFLKYLNEKYSSLYR